MSTELQQLHQTLKDHVDPDARFQDGIDKTLKLILNKLDPDHDDYINRNLENDMKVMKEQVEPLLLAYNSIVFTRKLIIGVSGFVVALVAIGGTISWVVNAVVHK